MVNIAQTSEDQSFRLGESRWANNKNLAGGPLWKSWNRANALPRWFWQRTLEYPWLFPKIQSLDLILDVGATYPFVLFKKCPNAVSVDCRKQIELNHPNHKHQWLENQLLIADDRKIPLPDRPLMS